MSADPRPLGHEPLVSIIVPMYRVEEYLPALVESLQTQTLSDFEAIFVDDASPDNSAEIIANYQRRDKRVKVLRLQKNGRQGAARNAGLDLAKGQFITFVDADDRIAPEFLETMHSAIERHDADIVMCNALTEFPEYDEPRVDYDSLQHIDIFKNKKIDEYVFSKNEIVQESSMWWDRGNFFIRPECWGKFYRKKMLDYYRIRFSVHYSEDVAFILCAYLVSENVISINKKIYIYNRKNIHSDLHRERPQYMSSFGPVMAEVARFAALHVKDEHLKKMFLANFYFSYLPWNYKSFIGSNPKYMDKYKHALELYCTCVEGIDPHHASLDVVNEINALFAEFYFLDRNAIYELCSLWFGSIMDRMQDYLVQRNSFSINTTLYGYGKSVLRSACMRILRKHAAHREYVTKIHALYQSVRGGFSVL